MCLAGRRGTELEGRTKVCSASILQYLRSSHCGGNPCRYLLDRPANHRGKLRALSDENPGRIVASIDIAAADDQRHSRRYSIVTITGSSRNAGTAPRVKTINPKRPAFSVAGTTK